MTYLNTQIIFKDNNIYTNTRFNKIIKNARIHKGIK